MTMSSKLDRRAVSLLPINESESRSHTIAKHTSEEELQLKTVWEEVIPNGLTNDDHGPESDFFHIGGTSLLLIQLQSHIKKRYGVFVRLADLFVNSVLQPMAQLIGHQLGNLEEMETPPKIDWEWETRPSADLRIGTPADGTPLVGTCPKSILVTGGAGFLGRALLRSAIRNPNIERVHAVAVHQLKGRLASGLLPSHQTQCLNLPRVSTDMLLNKYM